MPKDYYRILQVHPKAEDEIIEAAYKRLVVKYYPKVNKTIFARQQMLEIDEAFRVLSNPSQRAAYDRERDGFTGIDYSDEKGPENSTDFIPVHKTKFPPRLTTYPLNRVRASFMWWWVFALAANYILIVILSQVVYRGLLALSQLDVGRMCTGALGDFGCLILLWVLLEPIIIIGLLLVLLFKLIFFIWPFITPIISLSITVSVINTLKPSDDPLLSHLRWPDFLGAVLSFPLAYFIFTKVLDSPSSPLGPADIVKSWLPSPLENMWFIILGASCWLFTWFILSLVQARRR